MSRQITDTILNPENSEVVSGATVRFKAVESSLEAGAGTVPRAESASVTADGSGNIDITLNDGVYHVFFKASASGTERLLGKATVTSGSATTLAAVLGASAAVSSEVLAVLASYVLGPASSTDNEVPRFDGVGGKTLQGSGVVIDDDGNLSGHGLKFVTDATTARTLTQADNGKTIWFTSASAITVTVPQNSTEAIKPGFECLLIQKGAGVITVQKEGSDTLLSSGDLYSSGGAGAPITIAKQADGSWWMGGDRA